jgi:hypothetical protein
MRQRLRSHLTYANVMATIAVFIALGGTTYAATGGNFILGQSNSAGAPTQLSSATTNSAGALKVTNTNTTTAGRGISALGGAGGFGLWASGGNTTKNTAAVHGQSGAGNAVEGFSTANPASGVFGQDNNANSYGVAGHSDNGVAVVGDSSSGWAIQALGNTTQTRAKNGFVKAMALVKPAFSGGEIQQCFNSQVPPSQATTPPCGITYLGPGGGAYTLDFGFKVDDRIALATSQIAGLAASVIPTNTGTTDKQLLVHTRTGNTDQGSPFYIVVY